MSDDLRERLRKLGVTPGAWSKGGVIDPKYLHSLTALRALLVNLDDAIGQQLQRDVDKLTALKEQRLVNAGSD